MDARDIVEEISRRAWSFGVAVLLSPSKTVKAADGIECSGYFDGEGIPILSVATSGPPDKWLGTLLHEYSHATQWIENCPAWTADTKRDLLWDWINGKQVRGISKIIAAARECEADCERRTIRLIREMEAPIDLDRYTRAANAYVHFYNVLADKRKWYASGRGPYDVPEVRALSNATLDTDFRKTPPALRAAIESCLA